MIPNDIMRFELLRKEMQLIRGYCPNQYFSVQKCKDSQSCGRTHVDCCFYPCIHFYTGNCKYSFNCLFSHSIKRMIVRPEPAKGICRKLYEDGMCPFGNKCKNSHDLKEYPCVYNSTSKCKFSDANCRYSHEKKLDSPILCFFNLMNGCHNDKCENKHSHENYMKYVSYEGPI